MTSITHLVGHLWLPRTDMKLMSSSDNSCSQEESLSTEGTVLLGF